MLAISLLAGCAESTTPSSAGATPGIASGPTGSESSSAVSYLQRRDTPPEGVAAQLQFFLGGGPECGIVDETVSAIEVVGIPHVAGSYRLCVTGLEAETPVEVAITLADGTVRDHGIRPVAGVALLPLVVEPGDPIGTYAATAIQGGTRISGSYEVVRPSFPAALTLPPTDGRPGATFRLAFAGFPPESRIALDLYQRVDATASRYVYLTTLPQVEADDAGEAIYELRTAPSDPMSTYCVVFRLPGEAPHEHCDASFQLTP